MPKVKITARQFSIPAGHKIGISEELADDRLHAMQKVRKGVYLTTATVNFREGDVLDYDHELTPGLLQSLEPIGKPKAEEPPAQDPPKAQQDDEDEKPETNEENPGGDAADTGKPEEE